jgi:hypothetical protein
MATERSDNSPLRVPVYVQPGAAPVVRALARLHLDLGSVAADKLGGDGTPGHRYLCVALVDLHALQQLGHDLRRELADDPVALQLTDRVAVVPLALDTLCVAFLDIFAVEA